MTNLLIITQLVTRLIVFDPPITNTLPAHGVVLPSGDYTVWGLLGDMRGANGNGRIPAVRLENGVTMGRAGPLDTITIVTNSIEIKVEQYEVVTNVVPETNYYGWEIAVNDGYGIAEEDAKRMRSKLASAAVVLTILIGTIAAVWAHFRPIKRTQ